MEKEIRIDAYDRGILINEYGDKVIIEFAYPRHNKIKHIEVGLSDVRASDGIRVTYDFDRDGYIIEQPYFIEVDRGSYIESVEHWEETAFVQSWALEHKNKDKDGKRTE